MIGKDRAALAAGAQLSAADLFWLAVGDLAGCGLPPLVPGALHLGAGRWQAVGVWVTYEERRLRSRRRVHVRRVDRARVLGGAVLATERLALAEALAFIAPGRVAMSAALLELIWERGLGGDRRAHVLEIVAGETACGISLQPRCWLEPEYASVPRSAWGEEVTCPRCRFALAEADGAALEAGTGADGAVSDPTRQETAPGPMLGSEDTVTYDVEPGALGAGGTNEEPERDERSYWLRFGGPPEARAVMIASVHRFWRAGECWGDWAVYWGACLPEDEPADWQGTSYAKRDLEVGVLRVLAYGTKLPRAAAEALFSWVPLQDGHPSYRG